MIRYRSERVRLRSQLVRSAGIVGSIVHTLDLCLNQLALRAFVDVS